MWCGSHGQCWLGGRAEAGLASTSSLGGAGQRLPCSNWGSSGPWSCHIGAGWTFQPRPVGLAFSIKRGLQEGKHPILHNPPASASASGASVHVGCTCGRGVPRRVCS